MKKILIAAAVILAATFLISELNITPTNNTFNEYRTYLKKFGKPMPNDAELFYRAKIFQNFVQTMEKHNADPKQTWQMGINQFSDLTKQQFVNTYLGEKNSDMVRSFKEEEVNAGFAGAVDWRTKGVITAVKNQGACGSCWAFAATAAHESYQVQFKNQPIEINLSEQQLVDCSSAQPYGNTGCNGGYGVRALEYIKDFGQTTGSSYPYVAATNSCKTPSGSYRIYGVAEVAGCSQIEDIIQRRPMAVRVDATNWHAYKSGIFDNCATNINHAVFMVGSSEQAWTIKNSWAATWGEQGYIRLKKGNTCAVCQGPSFPI